MLDNGQALRSSLSSILPSAHSTISHRGGKGHLIFQYLFVVSSSGTFGNPFRSVDNEGGALDASVASALVPPVDSALPESVGVGASVVALDEDSVC